MKKIIDNKKYFFKIFLVLVVSYLISNFSIRNVFLANSPKIRPNLSQYLSAKINTTKENLLANFTGFFKKSQPTSSLAKDKKREEMITFLKKNLQPITKGVSASSKDFYNYYEFRLNEIDWVILEYTLNDGKKIKIRYPKGTTPPPKEIFERE